MKNYLKCIPFDVPANWTNGGDRDLAVTGLSCTDEKKLGRSQKKEN